MSKVWWLLVMLAVVGLAAGCDPVVEIRVMTERDLTATSLVASPTTGAAGSPTAVPDTPEATLTPSPTEARGTEDAIAIATPLPRVTPSPSPTAHRLPTPARPRATATSESGSDATRIRFKSGAVSAMVSGQLGPQGSRLYVLRASAGQWMEVSVVSSTSGVSFGIWGEDGTVLRQHAENRTECVLPSSQDYFVALYSGQQATSYDLTVTISPLAGSQLTRIRFAPGATSAVREGRLEPGACAYYVLGAQVGQRMEVQVSPGEVVGLEVRGQDGSLWASGSAGSLIIEQLPQTGDYYLTLSIPSWAEATRYTLEVTIPPP
jgi:hypothetical protein